MAGVFDNLIPAQAPAAPAAPAQPGGAFDDLIPQVQAGGGSDTVQTDPLARSFPNPDYARSQPVAHTGYAAQVARTLSGNGPDMMPPPQTSPLDFAKGAAETAVTWIPGIPGDTEAFARLVMSPFGVSRQNVIPTTGDIANDWFGKPSNQTEAAGRDLGSLASPLIVERGLPMLANGVSSVARTAANAVKGKSVDDMALDAVHNFSGGPISLDTRQIIPGSQPTLVEAAVDNDNLPGVANLQRTVYNLDPNGALAQREMANSQARTDFFNQLAGTPGDIESAKLARSAITDPMRSAAFANASEADASGVNAAINRILASPEGQRDAVVSNLQNIQSKLQVQNPLVERIADAKGPLNDAIKGGTLGPDRLNDFTAARLLLSRAAAGRISEDDLISGLSGLANKQKIVGPIDNALAVIKSGPVALESDPKQLYGIRKALADQLSATGPKDASDARLATSEMMTVKDALDKAIQSAAPGYQEYLDKYAELSKPVDQMEYLQGLNLGNQRGDMTLAKVRGAIQRIQDERSAPGVRQAKSLTDDQIAALQALHDDLYQASNLSLGRAVGSNTVQNLAGTNALQSMLPGKIGAFVGKVAGPETVGSALGAGIGSIFGPYGATGGAVIGNRLGSLLTSAQKAKNSAITGAIQDMVLNPQNYQAAALRAANAGKAAAPIGNAGVSGIGAIANNPVIRALLLQRAALSLAPQPAPQLGP